MTKVGFLALDFMIGIGDHEYAAPAVERALVAVEEARNANHLMMFTKVGFRQGHPEISSVNRVFREIAGTSQFVGNNSRFLDALMLKLQDITIDKKRFSALVGSDLWTVLRAQSITLVTICGLSTSGVVLSTALELIDADVDVTVLSDACADPNARVHEMVIQEILSHRACVETVADWRLRLRQDNLSH